MTATFDSDASGATEGAHGGSTVAGDGSRLGIQLGDDHWLIDLADVNEVIPVPELTEVPFTRHWFAGVTSIRGNPVAVVDLNAFFGGAQTEAGERARLAVVAQCHRINSALLVGCVLGLQPFDRFVREPDGVPQAPWIEGLYRDPDEQRWTALSMHGLLGHPDFLRIELPA
ncbi:MAG: chemotaxis protein CheW [Betaproteobacteria bacterium]|nr:chemotaxis protein CheW [Betaproteobacteria bacterium]